MEDTAVESFIIAAIYWGLSSLFSQKETYLHLDRRLTIVDITCCFGRPSCRYVIITGVVQVVSYGADEMLVLQYYRVSTKRNRISLMYLLLWTSWSSPCALRGLKIVKDSWLTPHRSVQSAQFPLLSWRPIIAVNCKLAAGLDIFCRSGLQLSFHSSCTDEVQRSRHLLPFWSSHLDSHCSANV